MVSNFDFLKKDFPVLSNFGKMAEKYCYSDSNSCLMKLGMIGETIVNLMFTYDRIAFPHDNTAVARIDTLSREGLLTSDLVTILHGLRKVRNKAVHENYASIADDKIFCRWHTVSVNGLCRPMEIGIILIEILSCRKKIQYQVQLIKRLKRKRNQNSQS